MSRQRPVGVALEVGEEIEHFGRGAEQASEAPGLGAQDRRGQLGNEAKAGLAQADHAPLVQEHIGNAGRGATDFDERAVSGIELPEPNPFRRGP
jgi:hypothetical protein